MRNDLQSSLRNNRLENDIYKKTMFIEKTKQPHETSNSKKTETPYLVETSKLLQHPNRISNPTATPSTGPRKQPTSTRPTDWKLDTKRISEKYAQRSKHENIQLNNHLTLSKDIENSLNSSPKLDTRKIDTTPHNRDFKDIDQVRKDTEPIDKLPSNDRDYFIRSENKHVVRRSRRFSSIPSRKLKHRINSQHNELDVKTPIEGKVEMRRTATSIGQSQDAIQEFKSKQSQRRQPRSRSLDSWRSDSDQDEIVLVFPSLRFTRYLRDEVNLETCSSNIGVGSVSLSGIELSTHYARLANDYMVSGRAKTDARHNSRHDCEVQHSHTSSDSSTETLVPNGLDRTVDRKSIPVVSDNSLTTSRSSNDTVTFSDLDTPPGNLEETPTKFGDDPGLISVAPPLSYAPCSDTLNYNSNSTSNGYQSSTSENIEKSSRSIPIFNSKNNPALSDKPPIPPRVPISPVMTFKPRLRHPLEPKTQIRPSINNKDQPVHHNNIIGSVNMREKKPPVVLDSSRFINSESSGNSNTSLDKSKEIAPNNNIRRPVRTSVVELDVKDVHDSPGQRTRIVAHATLEKSARQSIAELDSYLDTVM